MTNEFRLAEKLYSKPLPKGLKKDILSTLNALKAEQTFDLAKPPLLTSYSDVQHWQQGVKHLQAPQQYDNMFAHFLYEDEHRTLMLVWAKDFVPDEEHLDLQESFLILEGTCTFQSEQFTKDYAYGDFVAVPDCHHAVKVTSSIPLKAIIQRLKVA